MPACPLPFRPVTLLLLAALCQPGVAQITQLEPVQVPGQVEPAPTVTETTAHTLEQRQIRSFDDFGRRSEPGVHYNRNSESINIRGLDRGRVRTTIDGIHMPWLTDGARSQDSTGGAQGGLDAIDFNGLSKVDVVRGAGAGLAGSGALGGGLQLYTLNPEDVLADGQHFGGLTKTDYDSADHSRGLNAALAGQQDNTAWLLQAGVRRGHELQTQGDVDARGALRSQANPARSKQHSVLAKLQQQFSGGHSLRLTGETFEREQAIDLKATGTNYVPDSNHVTEHVKRDRLSLEYAFRDAGGNAWADQAKTMVYWQKQRRHDDQHGIRVAAPDGRAFIPDSVFAFFGLTENPFKPLAGGFPSGPFGRDNQIEKTAFGVSGNLEKRTAWAGVPNHLTLGFSWTRLTTEQFSAGYDNCPALSIPAAVVNAFGPAPCQLLHSNQADMPKAQGTQWALHASSEMALADGRVKLIPGVRYDRYAQKPKITGAFANNVHPASGQLLTENKDGKLSASLLTRWQATENALLYAQWAQGFRAPDATELYMNYGALGNYLSLGNPDLKPEESQGIELGTKLGNRQWGASFSFFDNRYKNFIDVAVPVAPADLPALGLGAGDYPLGVTRAANLNRVRIVGLELGTHWEFTPSWRVWGSLVWAKGKDRQTRRYLNSVAPLTGLVGLGYTRAQGGADLMLRMAKARDKVSDAADFKAPGYGLVDFSAYWQPAAWRGVKFQLGVYNVLDKKYWNALNVPNGTLAQAVDYYTESGRSLRASVSWQF